MLWHPAHIAFFFSPAAALPVACAEAPTEKARSAAARRLEIVTQAGLDFMWQ